MVIRRVLGTIALCKLYLSTLKEKLTKPKYQAPIQRLIFTEKGKGNVIILVSLATASVLLCLLIYLIVALR